MSYLKLILISLFLFSFGCSTNKDKKRHHLFLKQVQSKREMMGKAEYKIYIKKMIDSKEGELLALKQQFDQSNKMMDHHEVMSGSTGLETHSFNKVTTGINLKKIDTRIKTVENELFLLKSQLAR